MRIKLKDIACPNCSKVFHPKNHKTVYCSPKCQNEGRRKRTEERTEKHCPQCQETLPISEFHKSTKTGSQNSCKACQKKNTQLRKRKVKFICIDCNNEKEITISDSFNKRTTNRRCLKCARKAIIESNNGHSHNYTGTEFFTGSLFASWKLSAARRNHSWDITKEDLVKKFKEQKGICSLSGILMDTSYGSPYKPSIDRIDSSKGYTTDNVQFVCSCVNIMKNKLPEDFFIKMCKEISSFHPET